MSISPPATAGKSSDAPLSTAELNRRWHAFGETWATPSEPPIPPWLAAWRKLERDYPALSDYRYRCDRPQVEPRDWILRLVRTILDPATGPLILDALRAAAAMKKGGEQ